MHKPSAGQAVVLWSLVLLSILVLVIVLTQTRLSTVSSHTGTSCVEGPTVQVRSGLFGTGPERNFPVAPVHCVTTGERIQEDDPGWDCKTMGNKICGYAGNLGFTCPTGNGNRTPQELDLCPPNSTKETN